MEFELPLTLDRSSRTPLSVQVAAALRDAASGGSLRDGDRLPSSRALAERLGVSRTVTAAAYDQLHAEGWTSTRHGSGTFVSAAPTRGPQPPTVPASRAVPDRLELFPGMPCLAAIDTVAWRRAWRAAADGPPLDRPVRDGLPEYRAAVAEHLLRHRGLTSDVGALLATSGTSSATAELATAVLSPGDVVAMEEPGYGRSVGALRAAGMTVAPVPIDADGLRVDAIPESARAVYCTPAHQFPLGARMPAKRRVELVEQARRRGQIIVEDDYDGELRYDTAPLPLLAALAPDVVVHLGTTSKVIGPVLGTGWMLAPPDIAAAVFALRERTGTRPSPAGQRVFAEFARAGDLSRHLRRLRRELAERRAITVNTLRAKGIRVVGDAAGTHVVVPLESAAAEAHVIEAGEASGILLDGLRRHHIGEPVTFGIALGYTSGTRTELAHAVELVANACVTGSAPRTTVTT